MADDVTPYASIHEALGALEDNIDPLSFSGDDPHVVRVVVRSGEQYQATVRQANVDEITLVNLPPHGATKRINAADITYLAVALPAPQRWFTVVLATLGLGDFVVIAARLARPWLSGDSLIVLTVIVGMTAALIVFRGFHEPGSNVLPWVVTFCEPTATFGEPTASR